MLLTQSGKYLVFGNNYYGQLGITRDKFVTPTEFCFEGTNNVPCLPGSITFAFQNHYRGILIKSGKCFVSGENSHKALGLGCNNNLYESVNVLTELIIPGQTIVFAAFGGGHTVILTKSGKCYVVGSNHYFQLGLGHNHDIAIATELCIPDPKSFICNKIITFVACGYSHTMVLTKSNKCFGFGSNGYGQLGTGNTTVHIDNPAELKIPDELITYVSCGYSHTIIVTKSGKCFGFGSNAYGQLGINRIHYILTPTELVIPNQPIITFVACGDNHSFVLTGSQKCFGFGANGFGQLGTGIITVHIDNPTELTIPNSNNIGSCEVIIHVTCKGHSTIVLTKSGKCFVFGLNSGGELGLGHCDPVYTPTELNVGEKIVRMMDQRIKVTSLSWEIQKLLWLGKRDRDNIFSLLPREMIREIVKFSSEYI